MRTRNQIPRVVSQSIAVGIATYLDDARFRPAAIGTSRRPKRIAEHDRIQTKRIAMVVAHRVIKRQRDRPAKSTERHHAQIVALTAATATRSPQRFTGIVELRIVDELPGSRVVFQNTRRKWTVRKRRARTSRQERHQQEQRGRALRAIRSARSSAFPSGKHLRHVVQHA